MPSHALFFAETNQPDWDHEPPPDTAEFATRRRKIADAIIGAFPGMEECTWPTPRSTTCIELHVASFEIVVYHDYLHLRLRWRSVHEMQELRLTDNLHRLARVVREVAGFGFFEHGCQGLGVQGDIDKVPSVISGATRSLREMFGVAEEVPV